MHIVQVEQTCCTTSLTLRHQAFPKILQISQIQTTTPALLLQLVIGKSRIARINNVLYARQVRHHLQNFALHNVLSVLYVYFVLQFLPS